MSLILLRHTVVDLPPGTCYGQLDAPLRVPHHPPWDGVTRRLRALLQRHGLRLRRVVSSPLQRAWQLACAQAEAAGLPPPESDPRWMELNFGAWEGRRWDVIPRHESDPWAQDYHHRAPPGGETHAALAARVHAALDALAHDAAEPQSAVLVVAHAGPIRVALGRAQGLPVQQLPDTPLDFGGLCHLQARPGRGWQLAEVNA